MSKQAFIALYNKLDNLPDRINHGVTKGKILPVAAEGNCPFRALIESLITNATSAIPETKEVLINYLMRIYFVNLEGVNEEHQKLRRSERDISFDDFVTFIAQFREAKVEDGSLTAFFNDYFPLHRDTAKTFAFPRKDKTMRFMSHCLRRDIVEYKIMQQSRHVTAEDLKEDNFFTLDKETCAYFRHNGVDLHIYENNPFVVIGENSGNALSANVVFDRGSINEWGEYNNGHYYVLFKETTFNILCSIADLQIQNPPQPLLLPGFGMANANAQQQELVLGSFLTTLANTDFMKRYRNNRY